MTCNINYISLEYTKKDKIYIDELMTYLNLNSKEIVDFFNIDNFGENVYIKLFDDLSEFRSSCKEKRSNKDIPEWLCGLCFYSNGKFFIYTLTIDELKKTDYHSDYSLKELKALIMHEFVHVCCKKYTNNKKNPVWLSEGLAVNLSNQFDAHKLVFNASLNEVLNGGANYINYHSMVTYVLNNYGRKYILELLDNPTDFIMKETTKLYNEVSCFYKKNKGINKL